MSSLKVRNHGGISSGASGNRHFCGVRGAWRTVEAGARDRQGRRRDSTGHGGGSNLLLQHHSRKRGKERGTRLEDGGSGEGKQQPARSESEGSDACLVSSAVVEVDVSFICFLPTAMNIFRLIGEPTHTPPSSLVLTNVSVCRRPLASRVDIHLAPENPGNALVQRSVSETSHRASGVR